MIESKQVYKSFNNTTTLLEDMGKLYELQSYENTTMAEWVS